MPPKNMNTKFHKPQNMGKTFKRLLKYIGKYKYALLLVFVFIAISALVAIASSTFVSIFLENYVLPHKGKLWADVIAIISKPLIIMAVFFLSGVVCSFVYSYIMMMISTSMLKSLRDELFTHMQSLPISYFDTHTHGELMSRYTNDVDTLREVMSNGIPQLINSTFSIIGSLVSMIILSWQLTLIILATLFGVLFVIRFLTSRSGKNFRRQQKGNR